MKYDSRPAGPNEPDVVIGGAPRSGTTFLCELLVKNPDIYIPRPFIPEPKILLIDHASADAELRRRYAAHFIDAPPAAVRIEKTSYYLENEEARVRFSRILPSARMVFILRDPIARAYSNWLWSTKNGLETLSFAEAVALEGRRQSPLPPDRAYARPFDYVTRGEYGSFVGKWIAAIGRSRLAVYQLEAVLERPEESIAHLQQFIGVIPLPWSQIRTGIINAADSNFDGPSPHVVEDLRHRLAPQMFELAELTGIDVGRWGF